MLLSSGPVVLLSSKVLVVWCCWVSCLWYFITQKGLKKVQEKCVCFISLGK